MLQPTKRRLASPNEMEEDWLTEANQMIARLNGIELLRLSAEDQELLLKDLHALLTSAAILAPTSWRVRVLGPTFFFHLGSLYGIKGNWQQASYYIKEAEEIAQECVEHFRGIDKEDAELFGRVLANLRDNSLPFAEARSLLQTGAEYIENGAWQIGLEVSQAALDRLRQTNDTNGKAHAYLQIGEIYQNFGDYEVALTYYADAIRFFRRTEDQLGAAIVSLKMGVVNIHLQQYGKARQHIAQAHAVFLEEEITDRVKIADEYLSLLDKIEQTSEAIV